MCGIAGFLTQDGEFPDRVILERMCDRIAHRGPDAYGVYQDDRAALGHRRLSIIDLSTGDQPLGNEDGTIQVVFNGEIYNYRELRLELERKGHHFTTRSDTEVLVHLYEEAGERMPEYLNGMFALALWDAGRQELFAARDRLGKKPFYYSCEMPGLRFCFASELKSLTVLPGFRAEVDYRAVSDFLALSYIPDPQTIYRGISRLEPGQSITVTRRGLRLRKYWEPRFEPEPERDFDSAVEEVRALAGDAVACRLVSDVPLGAFLSGGVDSSAVVGLMARGGAERVKTFSIGFTDRQFDELRFARMAVDRNRTEHYEQVVSPSMEEAFEVLVSHFDEPFGDDSAIPMLYLSRMTRQHVTVALCGDGADELFGGYRRYYFGILEERLRRKFPDLFRRSVIRAGGKYYPKLDFLPRVFRAKTLLTNLSQDLADSYFTSMSAFRDTALDAVLSLEARRQSGGYSPRENFRARFGRWSHLDPLAQMQAVDLETYLPGDILVKADRTTMAYSLEGRSPWLDYRLAELSFRLPSAFKVDGKTGKHLFKQAVAPYVPGAVMTRTKMGFSVPLAAWLRSSLKPLFRSLVLREEMEPFCSVEEARRIWNEHQSGLHNHQQKLWNLLVLAAWRARHGSAPQAFSLAGVAEG